MRYHHNSLTTRYPPPGGALISRDQKYRHNLWRWVDASAQLGAVPSDPQEPKQARAVLFVGLNPSKADAVVPDLTVTKCVGYARLWGYDLMLLGNLYDYRTKSPQVLFDLPDERFRYSDEHRVELVTMAQHAERIVVCWGSDGACYPDQVARVLTLLRATRIPGDSLQCLGRTKGAGGQPKHPSRIAYATELIPYR